MPPPRTFVMGGDLVYTLYFLYHFPCKAYSRTGLTVFLVVANLTDWGPDPEFLDRIQDPQYRGLAEVLHSRSEYWGLAQVLHSRPEYWGLAQVLHSRSEYRGLAQVLHSRSEYRGLA